MREDWCGNDAGKRQSVGCGTKVVHQGQRLGVNRLDDGWVMNKKSWEMVGRVMTACFEWLRKRSKNCWFCIVLRRSQPQSVDNYGPLFFMLELSLGATLKWPEVLFLDRGDDLWALRWLSYSVCAAIGRLLCVWRF